METKAFNEILSPLEGTMWTNIKNGHALDILKKRVKELRVYLYYIDQYHN